MSDDRLEAQLNALAEPLTETLHVEFYGVANHVAAVEDELLVLLGRFFDRAVEVGKEVSITVADRRGTYSRDSWSRVCGRAMLEDRPAVDAATTYPDSSYLRLELDRYPRGAIAELAGTVGLSPTAGWSAADVAEFARELAGVGCFIGGIMWCQYSHPALGGLPKYDTFRPAVERRSLWDAAGLAGPHGFGTDALRRYVLGPAWGLLLSGDQVEALGGSDVVRRTAPVASVRDAGEGLWLEVTAQPNDDDVAPRLEAVTRFLAAVVPTVDDVQAANHRDSVLTAGPTQVAATSGTRSWRRDAATPEVEVEVGSTDFELRFTIEFDARLEPTGRGEIDELLAEWFADGLAGRYGGSFHDGYRGTWTTTGVITSVDCGSQPVDLEAALSDLARRLFGWGDETGTTPPKIIIGHRGF